MNSQLQRDHRPEFELHLENQAGPPGRKDSIGRTGRWKELGYWGTGQYIGMIDIQIEWNPESKKLASLG